MDRTYAHTTAGATAADARTRDHQGLGSGWPTVTSPCVKSNNFAMAITPNKRQPRRLGQRST